MSFKNVKLFPSTNSLQVSFGYDAIILKNTPESIIIERHNVKESKMRSSCKKEKSDNEILKHFSYLQKRNSLIPEIISDKSSADVSVGFVKHISKGFSFADDVIEERSPHTIPYIQSKFDFIYKENSVIGSKPISQNIRHKKGQSRSLNPGHLTPIKNENLDKTVKRSISADSCLLGVFKQYGDVKNMFSKRECIININ